MSDNIGTLDDDGQSWAGGSGNLSSDNWVDLYYYKLAGYQYVGETLGSADPAGVVLGAGYSHGGGLLTGTLNVPSVLFGEDWNYQLAGTIATTTIEMDDSLTVVSGGSLAVPNGGIENFFGGLTISAGGSVETAALNLEGTTFDVAAGGMVSGGRVSASGGTLTVAGTLSVQDFTGENSSLISITGAGALLLASSELGLGGGFDTPEPPQGFDVSGGAKVFALGTLALASNVTIDLDAQSVIEIGGSTDALAGIVVIDPGGVLTGGIITTPVRNNGDIIASAGSMTLEDAVTGTGAVTVDSGGTLLLDGAISAGQTVTFGEPSYSFFSDVVGTNDLIIGDIGGFAGTIDALADDDVIDVKGVQANTVTYDPGSARWLLEQTAAGQPAMVVASLDLTGLAAGAMLIAQPDGSGGTDVTVLTPWPIDPLDVILESGGDWSPPDANRDSTYTGTVLVGLEDGDYSIQVQGATITREEDELAFSAGATVTPLFGVSYTPILQGAFNLTYDTQIATPLTTQPGFLAQLPITVTHLQIDTEEIGIDYAMSLPAPFNTISVPDLAGDGSYDLDLTPDGYVLGGTQGSIALPTITNAAFFGLFTASFTDGAISVTPSGSAVHIQGKLVTASPFTGGGSVTLDVAGTAANSNYISISDNEGVLTYGGTFMFAANNWRFPGGWGLQSLSGTVDINAQTISLAASVDIPFSSVIDIGVAGTIGFSYGPWQLGSIGLDITETGGGIAIPGTPLYLENVAGTIVNLNPLATDPITLTGTLGFDVGPSEGNFHLGALVATGTYIAGQSFTAGITGQFGVFAGTALGTLTGTETFNWANGSASGNVNLSLLANAFNGTIAFTESPDAFSLAGTATLKVPKTVTAFGGTYTVPSFLVGSSLSVMESGAYIFSGPQQGGSIAASGRLVVGAHGLLGTVNLTITAGIDITLPSTTSNGNIDFIGSLSAGFSGNNAAVATSAGLVTLSGVPPVTSGTYDVAAGAQLLMLSAYWTTPSDSAPTLALIEPNGTTLDASGFGAAGVLDVTSLDSTTAENLAILEPASGDWQLQVDDPGALGQVSFGAYEQQATPTLSVAAPSSAVGGGWTFQWSAANLPENATITFYAVSDASTLDGTPISAPLAATAAGGFTWTGSGVAPGSYYVYAELDGDGVPPVDSNVSATPLTTDYSVDVTLDLSGPASVAGPGSFTIDLALANAGSGDVTSADVLLQVPTGFAIAAGQTGIAQDGSEWQILLPDLPADGSVDVPVSVTSDGSTLGQLATFNAALETPGFNTAATSSAAFSLTQAACYTAGTRIATPAGDIAVEHLRPGDRVTLARGGSAEVIWTGHRDIDCRRHRRPREVWPIRVREGAFGDGMPRRDLLLSPDHAVFAQGVLVPVRYLVNPVTVVQERVAAVSYVHVELATHDVILAEGLPCETYLDTGNRSAFANGGPATMLHPDFARHIWDTNACAPLVLAGPELTALRRALLARAAALGHAVTGDAALHAVVDGRVVPPEITGRTHRFHLPPTARRVRLRSRSTVPAESRADSDDHRRLGVAVSALRLDGRSLTLDDPRLSSGWHAAEPGDAENVASWRWTDGDAGLAIAGTRLLEVDIAMTERYWLRSSHGTADGRAA